MPDLRLRCDHSVGKVSAKGQTNQANSAFQTSGVGKWVVIHVITWLRGWRPFNGRPGLRMAIWLQVKVRECVLGLRPTGCTRALSVTQKRRCSCSCGLWLYISIDMPHAFASVFGPPVTCMCGRRMYRVWRCCMWHRLALTFTVYNCLWNSLVSTRIYQANRSAGDHCICAVACTLIITELFFASTICCPLALTRHCKHLCSLFAGASKGTSCDAKCVTKIKAIRKSGEGIKLTLLFQEKKAH